MKFLTLGLIVLLTPALSAAEPEFKPGAGIDEEFLSELISAKLIQYRVPGAAVAVVKDGQPLLVGGFGIREVGQPGKVDADTRFSSRVSRRRSRPRRQPR